MNKLYHILKVVFLILGIIVFSSLIYFMTKDTFFNPNHRVKRIEITGVYIVKNDFVDTGSLRIIRESGENTRIRNNFDFNRHEFLLTSKDEVFKYGETSWFNINLFEAPFEVDFNKFELPHQIWHDNLQLIILDTKTGLKLPIEFPYLNFSNLFDDKGFKGGMDYKEIEITSKDNKITLYIRTNCY